MPISNKEVMRGHIVLYEGRVRVIKAVSELIMLEGVSGWIGGSLMNGEPISEEWLIKFGFQSEAGNILGNGKIVIEYFGGCFKHCDSLLTYQYCHQLQLLHFALTGEHLPVPKLPK